MFDNMLPHADAILVNDPGSDERESIGSLLKL